jgi:nucleoside-diphosphate-sugar epimerase
MRVLITGGAGYFGSVLAHQLLNRGHRVRVLDSLLHGGESLLGLLPQSDFEFIAGDLRSQSVRDQALANMEAVVHLAAIVGDPACKRQPDLAVAVNREATLGLWAQAQEAGLDRFVFASTCSNYGKMADPACHLTENSELKPVSLYAESKVAVEQALLGNRPANGPAATVLRISTLYGLSPRMRFDLTVNEFTMELMT